jgi:hypothetical protein
MKAAGLWASGVMLIGSIVAAAEPCRQQCCGELPPVKECPLTIVHQPPPPPPVFCPPTEHPNIKLFRIIEKPSVTCCAPPPPPIRVFTLPPPCAPVCKLEEPCVNWFRIVPTPPCVKCVPPLPPVRITSTTQKTPCQLPDVCVPSIRVVAQPPPGGPVCVDACRGLCGSCGNGAPIYRGK